MAQVTLKGTPVHTNGNLPSLHSKAPDFKLVTPDLNDVTLANFKGKKKLFYIVPSLDTSVCLLSTKKLNDAAKKHPEASFLVISSDLPFAQKRICGLEGIANVHPLSLMRSKDFAKAYGVLIQDGPLAGIMARAVLVLDAHDNVIYSELIPEITHEPDFSHAIAHL